MPNKDPKHVIQTGPYKGLTYAQKSAAKAAKRKAVKTVGKINKAASKNIIIKETRPGDIFDPKALKEATDNVEELVKAILLQDRPYVLPRPCGASVAPHQFAWQKVIQLDSAAKLKTAFLVANNLDNILSIGQAVSGAVTLFPSGYTINMNNVTVPVSEVCFDASLSLGDGKTYKSSTLPLAAGYVHYSSSNSKFVPGMKYYPGVVATMGDVTLNFYNAGGNSGALTFKAGWINAGVPVDVIVKGIVVNGGVSTYSYDLTDDAQWNTFTGAVANNASSGFYFTWAFTATTGNQYQPYGFNVSEVFATNTILTSPIIWTKYSLWELMSDGAVAYAQYLRSSRHNVTGNLMTLSNTTSELIKGGSVFAARLPGNSYNDLGGSIDDVIRVVGSQVHHKLDDPHLSEGVNYSFTPEKLQDWLFERPVQIDPFNGNPENIPYCAIAIDATNSGLNNGNPTFTLKGVISVEYLTTDPSNWFTSSPSSGPLFDALLNSLAAYNCVTCNPTHIEHLKAIAKKVVTSDNVKYALRTMIKAGIKVAPFVLSMI